ncbi:DUF2169 domain-containing protein [Massilia sp. W12]|uniref:DUF2169 family type VI secretion system accessory protein n=1 Tax=Massilia sp. W12 TaxID=3126507 RepID=UPI0030D35A4E
MQELMQTATPGKIKLAEIPEPPCPPLQNDSGLDAMLFNTIDPLRQAFHVLVAKSAWRITPGPQTGQAQLQEDMSPPPLADSDLAFAGQDPAAYGWRAESDLAPYKPLCDVLLAADAIAPGAQALPQFGVRLQVQAGGQAADAGAILIDKRLLISGARHFSGSGKDWRLSAPAPISRLPLRHTYACGGSLQLRAQDPALRHAPAAELLAAPDEQGRSLHLVAQSNPLGQGFARAWHLQSGTVQSIAAPQIEYLDQTMDGAAFWRAAESGALPPSAAPCPLGRAWLPRRQLAGVLPEQRYAADEVPFLPPDFDYRYWNCAPADQQCRYLQSGDLLRLWNLSEANDPAATLDAQGNHFLQCSLPPARCVALITLDVNGEAMLDVQDLQLDTLIYEQAERRFYCTWRLNLLADPAILSIRLLYVSEPAQIERINTLQSAQALLAQGA